MRHVDTVRLAARSDALVRRGALLLEDALRTASFPSAGPGRVLLIRSLPVGVIHSHLPPASLALTLERRVRELAVSAVPASDSSAAHRAAVFFRDDAEPSTALAVRLARGESVDAWFWPLAVPGFAPGQPRDEALRRVLFAALQSSAGPAAVVRLIEAVHADRGLEVLLAALQRQEGPALLQAFGGAPPSPPGREAPVAPEEVLTSLPLREVVRRWVEAWGAGDARAIWLTAVALVIERRGRLADIRLPEQAARVAARLGAGAAVRVSGRSSPEAPGPLPAAEDVPNEAAPLGDSAPASFQQRPTPPSASPVPEPSAEAPVRSAPRAAAPEASGDGMGATEGLLPAVTPAHASGGVPPAEPPPTGRGTSGRDMPTEPAPAARAAWPEVPQPTSVAGLLLLIPVLERLGISALLQEHPALAELELPERLLALIAERLGAAVTDPSRVIFDSHARAPRPPHCPFRLPESLRAQVSAKGAPLAFHLEGHRARTVLTDASGRLPLAITHGAEIEPGLLAHGRELLPALRGEDDLGLLLRGLLTAVRRWCRRHARLGLHTLVRRPGRITATRTHVDVLFDLQHTDVRIRGLGLDIDPGWVPWLGRVVRFHYLHGEA